MNDLVSISAITPLRQRLIDDMEVRRFSRETQRNYIRDIGRFATYLRRSPDTATAEEVRRFQIEQLDSGVPVPTMNSIVSALRFFFVYTIDRPDLARRLIRAKHPRHLPVVLSRDEVARLLNATFRSAGPAYRADHAGHLSLHQLKVMSAIERCRTVALGGHVEGCEDCGHRRIAWRTGGLHAVGKRSGPSAGVNRPEKDGANGSLQAGCICPGTAGIKRIAGPLTVWPGRQLSVRSAIGRPT